MLSSIRQPPVICTSDANRRKFNQIDDAFLLMALKSSRFPQNSKVNIDRELTEIRNNWLPKKELFEIRHRIKNLTCGRATDNMIRRWKLQQNKNLREGLAEDQVWSELSDLGRGIQWFGLSKTHAGLGLKRSRWR